MSNTEENLAAVERELAADVAMAEGRADAEDATLPEPAAGFIYLDYAATAPLCAEAAGAMAPFQVPGPANLAVNANANALYGVGRAAFDLLESARRRAAQALGARRPDEIVFTSGATEADDAAVLGLVQAAAEQRRLAGQKDRPLHVITSAIEHDAVLAPCRRLEGEGVLVTYLRPNRQGFIEASSLAEALTDDTVLVSVQAANSEVGAIQPIRELAALAHERGALFHTDAVQALAPFRFRLLSVHFIDGWAFDDPDQKARWKEPGAPDAIWRRYGELWCEAASNASLPYDAMSHPDLAKKFGYYPSFSLESLYDEMAEAARAGGRMVEVNTSGGYYACAEMFPAPGLLAAFCRAGVPCTVGCDSHDPANVARDIERAYGLMYEAGYRSVTVPTATGDRRSITIE